MEAGEVGNKGSSWDNLTRLLSWSLGPLLMPFWGFHQ